MAVSSAAVLSAQKGGYALLSYALLSVNELQKLCHSDPFRRPRAQLTLSCSLQTSFTWQARLSSESGDFIVSPQGLPGAF